MSLDALRDTLFISHALPEDNEFAQWLAVRLKNEGYKVWCELEQVHAGEHFWNQIQEVIRDRTIKFIFIGSLVSIQKSGVRDEWEYARSIQKEFNLIDFILPINLDGIASNSLIGLTNLAMLHFNVSWAHGLKALISKLNKDRVPKSGSPLSNDIWFKNSYSTRSSPLRKEEIFYSNWLESPPLPDSYFIHEFKNKSISDRVLYHLRKDYNFPVIQHDKFVISFAEKLPSVHFHHEDSALFNDTEYSVSSTLKVLIQAIIDRTNKSETFPTPSDQSNLLVQLLRESFHTFLLGKGLKTYNLSNEKKCYFYPLIDSTDKKVKYLYEQKNRSKQLTGKYFDHFWHYGISFNPRLRPGICFSLKGHIVFSDDGESIWTDKAKLHSARRKKGKTFFNDAWRDLLLAFLSSLLDSEESSVFGVTIDEESKLWFSPVPIIFSSEKGYNDPHDKARLKPIDSYDDNEDQEEDISSDFLPDDITADSHAGNASDFEPI